MVKESEFSDFFSFFFQCLTDLVKCKTSAINNLSKITIRFKNKTTKNTNELLLLLEISNFRAQQHTNIMHV